MRGRNRAGSIFFLTSAARVGIGNANPVKKPKVFELDPGAEAFGDPGAKAFGDPGAEAFGDPGAEAFGNPVEKLSGESQSKTPGFPGAPAGYLFIS